MQEQQLVLEKQLDLIARSSGPWTYKPKPKTLSRTTLGKDTQFGDSVDNKINNSFPLAIIDEAPSIRMEKDLLLRMLRRENEIRFSEEVQQLFTEADYNDNGSDRYGPFSIDRDIVIQLLYEFGFNPEKDDSFDAYRVSCGHFLDDPEVAESVVWMKYGKKFRVCSSLEVGDICPLEVKLVGLDAQPLTLRGFVEKSIKSLKPLVILAGSVS